MGLIDAIRRLPSWAEIVITMTLAFGYFMLASIRVWLAGSGGSVEAMTFDDGIVSDLIGIETIALLVLLPFLWLRGWRPADIGLTPTWRGTGHGLQLMIATFALLAALGLADQLLRAVFVTAPVPLPINATSNEDAATVTASPELVLFVSLLNGAYEEIFVAGYLITALSRLTPERHAVIASVSIRIIYHLYQGTAAIVAHLASGWLFAWVFLRRRDLWPLIVAHALWDLIALNGGRMPSG